MRRDVRLHRTSAHGNLVTARFVDGNALGLAGNLARGAPAICGAQG